MESNKSIMQVLENMNSTVVFKKKKSVLTSLIYLLLGIVLVTINSIFTWKSGSFISPLQFITGWIFVIVGIFAFFLRKHFFVSIQSNQVLKSHSIYFDLNEFSKLLRMVENGNLNELKTLKTSNAHALKLQVMCTDDAGLCLSQVVSFLNHEYVNITPVKQHTLSEAHELLTLINRK